eukprot:TRINITY_DN1927_c0_g1_i8.p2 TRINITY_DN1927_c0_g1~~TRINITY_DN1927_c0_g1_i8.p2  ORF type:complete len:440 (-),score=55.90 TRINITY_DN1927_c0_g1_i8:85-1404(-)
MCIRDRYNKLKDEALKIKDEPLFKGEYYITSASKSSIPVDSIPVFSSYNPYIEGTIVKVKDHNGKWHIGTAQIDEYMYRGSGSYAKYKFVPNNQEEYNKGMSIENTFTYELINKSWNSIKGIGNDLWNQSKIRTDKRCDSIYDFCNWFTMGIPDVVKSIGLENQKNGERAFETGSAYDIGNWLTIGFFDTVTGAINPKEPLSEEHFIDSFGLVSSIFGLKGISKTSSKFGMIDDIGSSKNVANAAIGKSDDVVDLVDEVGNKADILKNAGLDKLKVDEIVSIPKGSRPEPSTYLSKEYMDIHLSQFDDGLSVIQTEWAYGRYSETNGFVGVPDDNTLFVLPKKYCNEVVFRANGDISIIEKELGFPKGYFSDGGGLVRIDVDDVTGLNLRIPNGNETGANSLWLPGGYTSGNVPEAISDIIPLNKTTISRINVDQEKKL